MPELGSSGYRRVSGILPEWVSKTNQGETVCLVTGFPLLARMVAQPCLYNMSDHRSRYGEGGRWKVAA
jgi:hypothetical protein